MPHLRRVDSLADIDTHFSRRSFLRSSASLAALAAAPRPLFAAPEEPESIVKLLYESLKPEQRKEICFAWDYVDP